MAKQMTKKFQWMRGSIAESFGLTENVVNDAIFGHEANKQKIELFLQCEGPPKLLVYYQTPDTGSGSDNDHNVIDAQLFLTYGDTERIKDKAVWFMRNLSQGKKKMNLGQANSEQVLFGQITPNPVKVLSHMIEYIYDPLMSSDKHEWGMSDPESKKEFLHYTEKFKKEVSQALKLMEPGQEHFKIKPEELQKIQSLSESERIQRFEEKFDEWIKTIEKFLNTEPEPKNEGPDAGPKTELEFWKQRMQTITNWSEQLKNKDFNMVKASLIKYKQNEGKKEGQENINKLMLSFQRLDLALTDRLNEAKDNVKYLSTLQKFIEPLYNGTPQQIIETLPSLMNAIKMIHTIARFYNTSDKMTGLFIKITNQMIKNCKDKIIPAGTKPEDVWKRDPAEVIEVLGSCIKLNREYKEAYKTTKEKVADMPKGKTFDFSETQIFNKFDQFVKRLQKLIEVFSNIQQFDALAKLNLEKMDVIIGRFNGIRDSFKAKRKNDLLDLTHSNFDKQYVSFNISISQLDSELQQFIDSNFSKSKSIEHSINLLKKFENTIKRDALKHNLTSKYNTILTNYASQLEAIQRVFNDQKSQPPIVRNMPQNAGKIIWSKHLYQKIAGPITKFPQNVIHSSEIKKYYGNYNTLGKMLTINEMWYYDLWVKQIQRSKAALQATLIVRHQTQKKLYVNFDVDIMQLIREAKCLDRQGIPIPESARIILLQQQKFKMYYNELLYVLKQYERIASKIKPICKNLLAPHIADMELKLNPGMSTLTWTSMNIDSYLNHVHQGLNKLEQLIINVNDIIENRLENNLRSISKVSLVSLPHENITFTLETFVSTQEEYINEKKNYLTSKNLEIQRSVDDLLLIVINYSLDPRIDPVKAEEVKRIKKFYFYFLYDTLLSATQGSLNSMKHRVCGSNKAGSSAKLSPFFEVDVQLSGAEVQLNPSLQQIQKAINKAATAVLRCSKTLYNWDQHNTEEDKKQSLYQMIAQDKQIVKVILLLTGSIQGTKNKINQFISKFNTFEWLWKKSISKSIKEFSKGSDKPLLSAYESEFKKFSVTEGEIDKIEPAFVIGAMQLKTHNLVLGLKQYTKQWKNEYAEDLHKKAKSQLYRLSDHISQLIDKLSKTVVKDIDSLGIVMQKLQQIRSFQAVIDISFNPVTDMYTLLDANLPGGITDKDQMDARIYLWSKWSTLIDLSEKIGKSLSVQQTQYLRTLKKGIKELVKDITDFRSDYERNGPMVEGILPKQAIQRLKRFDEQYEVREHQYKINYKGEQLFGLQNQKYPALEKTKAELSNLKKLYNLYSQVIRQITAFHEMLWIEVNSDKINGMDEAVKKYTEQCNKLPKDLKEWQAYKQLRTSIDNLKNLLPLITILKKDSIKDRHWDALNQKTTHRIPYDQHQLFIIEDLTRAKVIQLTEDIEEIGESAEKQKKIEFSLNEINEFWNTKEFEFAPWGKRQNAILAGLCVGDITQKLEQDQMILSSMNAQRHVVPFKKQVEQLIRRFSDTSQILDLWVKVQTLWRNLEPVFTGGDIAKQMPLQAKQFAGIDKTWIKCMEKSFETKKVILCCELDLLKDNLPDMQKKLQECQKLLEAYLQGKRKLFPRFYFVSNPALLKILSQGSEPTSIQEDFEKLFDAITKVEFGKSDKKGSNEKTIITIIQQAGGSEKVPLVTPVRCEGNIQSWLKTLEKEMQETMRQHCRNAAIAVSGGNPNLESFVKTTLSQVSLMGIQLIWTQKITEALEKSQKENKGALESKKKQIEKMLLELTNLCLLPIETALQRTKIETLVTVHVHQRDISVEMKCQSVHDFDWQKQTRLYWRSEQDTCMINITDWEQSYCYEFLGAKQRLCITPLTDRCYITLAQAMSMYYGGAPAGPAGTGKTETVKDLGRGLGIFVVVTNCSDQHRYRDMAKIFKGLVQSGLWGCFDEFNRIELEVLSVVAMQVESISLAKKQHVSKFMFPQEQYPIDIVQSVGYFITMNPGYAGRQELPENLKVLFRGVTMMMPDRQIIIKVKLASVGYQFINGLSKKFNILYKLCEQQLSKQRHYDFGLRNILSVLRTAGNTKRKDTKPENISTPEKKELFEEFLLMRSLRDMNMSKLVFDDIALFEGLLRDIFPRQTSAEKVNHAHVEGKIPSIIKKRPQLINRPQFTLKIIQVYETSEVRHGFMLLGSSVTGKTTILNILTEVLSEVPGRLTYRIHKMNPKAITDKEMYGVKSQISDDWIPGVFSTLWQKCNSRSSKFNIWLTCDGPVDAIWIENLNTVLDDNKILTLANGERIPMTDQCKLVFEVENLNNASPATVSRCGQVYVSPNDLGTSALYEGWAQLRALERGADEANTLKRLVKKFFDDFKICTVLQKNIKNPPMMDVSVPMKILNTLSLVNGLLKSLDNGAKMSDIDYEKVVTFSISWAVGGLYEASERVQFHEYLQSKNLPLPPNKKESETIFDYSLNIQDNKAQYILIKPEVWKPAPDRGFKFSQLLLPTLDSWRVEYLTHAILTQPKSTYSSTAFTQNGVLLIGGSGTAKTSSVLMWAQKFDPQVQLFKRINFSSATSPGLFQASIEQECDNKMGKEYGPPQNKLLAIFIDDMSMPFVNKWGDQVTLQIVRQLIEQNGFYWLDKAQRGNFKSIKNLSFVGAMNHPGGGRNDIPNRLKRQFFIFNMILPLSIEGIYGPIVRFQFRIDTKNHGLSDEVKKVIENLTSATIKLWQFVKKYMLPTPSKFHYLFNMRQLARTFKGILQIRKQSIMKTDKVRDFKPEVYAIGLWRHECERVFCDKLVNNKDKDTVLNAIHDISIESFGMEAEMNEKFGREKFFSFSDFLTPDQRDQEGNIVQLGPRNYEAVSEIDVLRKRAYECMQDFNNEPKNTKKSELVLFNDALKHLLKVTRILRQPRSSALLVGVGGSGKQSLTRLAAFIERMDYKQIELVKNYSEKDLKEDIKKYFEITGRFGKSCCFILTDSEIKKEEFLEYINMILSTGEIPGLLAKDQKETFLGDARTDYVKEFKGADPAPSELNSYLVDRIRDNLHVCLCFSPVGQKFRDRFRKFPALFNECTIDWFLAWPEEALVSVAESFIQKFKELDTQKDTKIQLMKHMGNVHLMVTDICDTYYSRMRRQVYFTPKSYLSYLQAYKKLYLIKYKELDLQQSNFSIGVRKINEASEAINQMKKILSKEEVKLKQATQKTEKMLKELDVEQKQAEKVEAEVNHITIKCERQAEAIARQKEQAEKELAAAIPAQMRAQAAVDSLDAASVTQMKANKKPPDIFKMTLDGVALFFSLKMAAIQVTDVQVTRGNNINFWKNSWEESGKFILSPNFDFLKNLKTYDKDGINNETIELLEPLLVTGVDWYNETNTGKVAKSIAAICRWLYAVYQYHEKSQIVKPKRIKLAQEEANLSIANQKLNKSREQLRVITEKLNRLKEDSQKQLDIKNELELQAQKTKKKITTAETLINSLSGERARWKKGATQISDEKRRLVGNCSLATAFISYCGPFNAEFRQLLAIEKFTNDMKQKEIPHFPRLADELTNFLVDEATVGEWNLQGLPKDTLSVQNGIMVTSSDRYPLLIDPQGQGQAWILRKYADDMDKGRSICSLNNPKFKDWFLKHCLENGRTLIIEGIQNEVDPILDPVLEKQIIWKKSRGSIKIAGGDLDFDKNFKMFLTCRLPNPSFSPQLSAKTTIIDFTVTQGGLEQQLLGRVISHQQKALEDSLNALLNDVNANKKALQKLDKDLLQRLTESTGNLLDDTSLMEVLNNTKTQAKEVAIKLQDAEIKTKQINEKRQQYRPVAIRGSALYFTLIELFLVNWMYNSSLEQFLDLFNWSLAQKSPQANSPQKRVDFIIKVMTKHVHRYVNRGLFEKDKITFMLMICFKILITAKKLTGNDIGVFLKAGAGEDIKTARQKPQGNQFNFIDEKSWLNILAFSKHTFGESPVPNFKDLPDQITRNQQGWLQFFEKNDPENYPIPDLAERMGQQKEEMRAFMQMSLIRSVREDRTLVASAKFISAILGQQYVDPISYPMQDIWAESKFNVPILFLLSPGADPTSSIDDFARKKKKVTEKVSMGQGQQEPARRAIKACMQSGGWVILQNCQLGLKFMEQTEQLIISLSNPEGQKPHEDFRLWITCQPHNRFPLGLLQKVIKVTNEPPKGLKAGLYKTFTTMINQEFLEKVDNPNWKNLIFTICYLHSIVIERRKFGSLGWCVPYEYNNSDLEASLCFVEKYLNNLTNMASAQTQVQQINTQVLKYMVCQVLYGGRITDDLDRELFSTFGEEYIKDGMLNVNEYVFFGTTFKYKMPANPTLELSKYHEYISTIPANDSPEVFGLDPNADLTFRMKESIEMVFTIMQTRPKQASSGGGKTREEMVKEKAIDLLSKLPLDYNEGEVKELIRKLSGPKALGAVGEAVPLNIFLSQQIARMQIIFNIVRKTLVDVCDAIDGQIIMTSEIMDSINAIFDARVPNQWVYDATGAEISWIIPTLAKWYNDLIERNRQLYEWLKGSRPYTFWLGGFFNPQGFLTAMKQQVTRMHKTGKPIGGGQVEPPWSLDDVVYQTTVKEKDQDLIRQGRDKDVEGVYIRQLILEGCRWYKNTLQAARPREMFSPLPLLHATAINKKKSGDDRSVYSCPVYRYAKRTDRYLIFRVNLNSQTEPPSKWKLKGVALLCARD